jgi:hypothetical protein
MIVAQAERDINVFIQMLDELLILKAQRNGEGFILQAPAAKESGGKYFLNEAIITAVGSDFHSVSDRMEVVIPPERLEQTLRVLMNQRNYTLAAFDLKEIAREYLGIKLPTMEVIEPESLEALNQFLPPQQDFETPDWTEQMTPHQAETRSCHPSHQSGQTSEIPGVILSAKQQKGMIEKRIARFLEDASIRLSVMQREEFHLRIENEPYIPLVLERQGDALRFIHYLEQNGDTFIDAELMLK